MRRYISLFLFLCTLLLAGYPLSAAVPGASARYMTFTNVASTSGTMSWVNGNGYGRIVVVNTDNDWTAEDLILTTAGPAYADNGGNLTDAPQVGATGSYVIDVLQGTQRSTNFTNFLANTTYYVKVYEFNLNGANRDYRNNAATLNPRGLTTMLGIDAPVISNTVTVTGAYAAFTWPRIGGDDATEYVVDISDDNFATYYSFYEGLDVGTLNDDADEVFEAFIPEIGTYEIRARAKIGTSYSVYSNEVEFTITDVVAPKFDIDPVLAMGTDLMTVQVVFDEEVTPTADKVAGELVAADFGVYDFAVNGGNNITVIVVDADEVDATTYTLTLSFSGRTTGTETFRIGPADNWSIFDMHGNPMDADDPNTIGNQKTNAITCNKATVFNSTKSLAYVTINQAVTGADAADVINLLDGETYTEDVDLAGKELTIRGRNAAGDDNPTVKPILIGTITVSNDAAEITNLSQINFNCANVATNKTNAVVLGNIAGQLTVTGCNFALDGTDKAIKANAGANLNTIYIGNHDAPVNNNTFVFGSGEGNAQVGVDLSGATGGVIIPDNGSINLRGNSFTFANAGDIGVLIEPARSTDPAAAPTRALEFRANTFANAGTAISFNRVYTDNDYPVFSTINVGVDIALNGNAFNNTGKAINMAYAEGSDLVDVMPFINLFPTQNTFAEANTGFTAGYYHNGTSGDDSFEDATWLAPGPVLLSDNNTAGTEDEVYPTIRSGYAAIDTDDQYLFIMDENTYDYTSGAGDLLAELEIDAAFTHTIKGKSKSAVIKEEWLAAGTAGKTITITNLTFEIDPILGQIGEAKAYGIQIADVPATAVITINDNNFNYGRYTYGISNKTPYIDYEDIYDLELAGTVNITANTFKSNETTARAEHDMGIAFGWDEYFQLAAGGELNISTNNFSFNCSTSPIDYTNTEGGSKYGSIGVYIGTYNTVGASAGTLTLAGNTFNGVAAGFNGAGTSILFENNWYGEVAPANSMTGSTINIYNGNDFNQVGYGIAFHTFPASAEVFETLPDDIDLYGTSENTNFTAADIYKAAWYDLTTTNDVITTNSKLYPSIQTAVDEDRAAVVNVGFGSYNEDVEVVNASTVTGFQGYGATCELAATYDLTISKDLTTTAGFVSPTVIINNAAAKLSDAIKLTKEEGLLNINGDFTLTDAATVTVDRRITIDGNADNNPTKAIISDFTLVLSDVVADEETAEILIKNFDFTATTATNIRFDDVSNVVLIDNIFDAPASGSAITTSGGAQIYGFEIGQAGHPNVFNFGGDATQEMGIYLNGATIRDAGCNIVNNTFNMDGSAAFATADRAFAWIFSAEGQSNTWSNPIAIDGNTFTTPNAVTDHSTIAIYFAESNHTVGINDPQVFKTNIFNNDGYAFSFVDDGVNEGGDASLCDLLTNGITLGAGADANTFTIGGSNLVANPVLGAWYTMPLATATALNPDCADPASEAGDFMSLTPNDVVNDAYTNWDYPNYVAGYINSTYTAGVKVKFDLTNTPDKDQSLVNGSIKMQTSVSINDGVDYGAWVDFGSAVTITDAMLNTDGYYEFDMTYANLTTLLVADGHKIKFRAVVTDMAGNEYESTVPSGEWVRDITKPVLTVTQPSFDGQSMQSLAQAAGTKDIAGAYPTFEVAAFGELTPDKWWNGESHEWEVNASPVWSEINDWTGLNWTYSFNPNISSSTDYNLYVRAKDAAGNIGIVKRDFTIDNDNPQVTALNYVDERTLKVVFDKAVQMPTSNTAANYPITGFINGTEYTVGAPLVPTTATRGMIVDDTDDEVTLVFPEGTFTEMDECEQLTVTVNNALAGGVRDIAGNLVDNDNKSETYLKPDLTPPAVVSIIRKDPAIGAGVPTNAATITYTVEFSEPVQNIHADDFGLNVTGGAEGTILEPVIWVDNSKKYDVSVTVTAAPNASTIKLTILDGSDIADIKCQGGAEALSNKPYTDGDVYTVDQTAPTATVEVTEDPIYNDELTQTVTVTYNEAMDAATTPLVSLSGANWTSNADGAWTVGNTVWTETFVHNGTAETNAAAIATVTAAAGATDAAGNLAAANYESGVFTIDTEAPTAIVAVTVNPINKTNLTQTVTVTYDEAMNPATTPAVSLSGANWGAATNGAWNLANTIYTVEFTHDGDAETNAAAIATVTAAGGATDAAGNEAADDYESGVFTIDTEAPTATVAVTVDPINNQNLTQTVTVTYNSAMNPATTPQVSLSGANWGAATNGAWNLANTIYTVEFTHDGDAETNAAAIATVTAAGGAEDLNGNETADDYDSEVFTIDTDAPTAVIAVTVDPINKTNLTQTVTVTYSEAMTGTPIVSLSGANWGAATNGAWNLANTIYTVQFTHDGTEEETTSTATVTAAGGPTDASGNIADADDTDEFEVDTKAPTVTITQNAITLGDAAGFYTTDAAVSFAVEFSEAVQNFTIDDITLNLVNTPDLTPIANTSFELAGPVEGVYTVTVGGLTGDGTVGITIVKDNFSDLAGNTMAENSVSELFTIDNTAPEVSSIEFTNCGNSSATVNFSKDIYSTANASGTITASSLGYFFNDPNALVTISGISNVSHLAVSRNLATLTLQTSNGELATGNETFQVRHQQTPGLVNQIYDRAGNPMDLDWSVSGTLKVIPAAPTGDAAQNFCAADEPTVADLTTTAGVNIKWYDALDVLLEDTDALATGTFYATQTVNGCESTDRLEVAVTVITPATPTGDADQTFCETANAMVDDLAIDAPAANYELVYYLAEAVDPIADPAATALVDGTNYWIYTKHTATNCLSENYLAVSVSIEDAAVAGNINPSTAAGNICRGTVLTAAFTEGSGGTGAAYEYQTLTGEVWSEWATYEVGVTEINTTNFDGVQIRNTRTASVCAPASNTSAWTVVDLPEVTTIADAQTRCEDGNVTFVAATTTPNAVIDWSLDNFTNTALAANNEFTTAITVAGSPVTVYYRARNTVTGCVSATEEVTGTAYATPVAKNVTGGPFCENTEATITVADGVAGISYILYRDKGTDDETEIETITPADAGNVVFIVADAAFGNYSVFATNNACDTEIEMNGTVIVNRAGVAAITLATGNTCGVNPFQVTDASVDNYDSFVWSHNGAGSFDDPELLNPIYTPAEADAGTDVTLTLTVTAFAGCDPVIRTKVLSVALPAPAAPEVAGVTEGCVGFQTTLEASSDGATEFNWYRINNAQYELIEENSATITLNPTETIYVKAENICGESDYTEVLFTLNTPSNLTFANQTVCVSDAQFAISGALPAGGTYTGDAVVAGNFDPATAGVGAHTVTYTYTNAKGCVSSIDATITVIGLPAAPTANNVNVCFDNTEKQATATPAENCTIKYYTLEDGGVETTAPTGTAANTYTAWAVSVNANGCESTPRVEVTLTINALPAAPTANDVTVTYDGTEQTASATAPLGWLVRYFTTVDGDVAATAPAGTNAGVYTAWAESYKDDSDCYSASRTLVTLTIEQADVTFELSDFDKIYTGEEQHATITNDQGLVLNTDYTVAGNAGTNADIYPITITLLNNNYDMINDEAIGDLVIGKKMLTVTADNKVKCFGQDDPALTYQITGYVDGEGIEVVTLGNFDLVRTGDETVGAYVVNSANFEDLSADNYNFNYVGGTFIINALPTTTVTGNNTIAATYPLELSTANEMTTYAWTASGDVQITNADQRTAQFTWADGQEGAQTVTLTYGNGTCENTAVFNVTVTNSCVDVEITAQPASLERVLGENAVFTVTATGTNPQYQWYKDGVEIEGATSATLTLTNVQYTDAADYHVVVTNTCSQVIATSDAASLNVYIAAPDQATTFTLSSTNAANLIVTQTANGNGTRKLVVIRRGAETTFTPENGAQYSADLQYGIGYEFVEETGYNSYVVYDGPEFSGSPLGISGLNSRTNYTVTIFEYNIDGVNVNTINYGPSSSVSGSTRRKDAEGQEQLTANAFEMTNAAPNPVRDQINFSILAVDGGEFAIELVNVSGETVLSRNQVLNAGSHKITFSLMTEKGGIAAGTYFLRVTSGGETLTQQVVVMP